MRMMIPLIAALALAIVPFPPAAADHCAGQPLAGEILCTARHGQDTVGGIVFPIVNIPYAIAKCFLGTAPVNWLVCV